MKQISFKMDEALYTQIMEATKREDRNASQIIRCALKEYFQKEMKKEDVPNE